MQALYQLSYSPVVAVTGRAGQQRHASVQDLSGSAVVAEDGLGEGSGVVFYEAPLAAAAA